MTAKSAGPLTGIRVLEIAGIGPGPFCGMLLADLGADVVVVERVTPDAPAERKRRGLVKRGKRSVVADLKTPEGVALVLELVACCDVLVEGMRPGVMERLGLGPEPCLARNPRLVYGRMTGWGQNGPLAQAAGHDLNYIALSGALWYGGQPGEPPVTPPSLVGDIGGGALYLAVGLLAGVLNARSTGQGQVVDAAIVDGSAHMMSLLHGLRAAGNLPDTRGQGLLDGAHWYNSYRCADGAFISLGAVEPQFYRELLQRLGLEGDPAFGAQNDVQAWPALRERFARLFAERTRAQWCELLEGTDTCFAPVLSPSEAAQHPHMHSRGVYTEDGGILQARPAPRFSATPADAIGPVPEHGAHTETVLRDWQASGTLRRCA